MILDLNIKGTDFFSIFQMFFSLISQFLSFIFSITIEDIPVIYFFLSIYIMFKLLGFITKGGKDNANE